MSEEVKDPKQLTLEYIDRTNAPIFLTGRAGTGKTTLLHKIIKTTYKRLVVAAPTGIAAINAGGVTMHSLLQLPFGTYVPDDSYGYGQRINSPSSVLKQLKFSQKKRKLLRQVQLLIIDEVSMLRADTLDCADTILRSIRGKKHLPFGGLQLLFIGDLHQLPPVVKDEEWELLKRYYKSPFFFDAKVFQELDPVYIELDKIYRQSDETFIGILNRVRSNSHTEDDIETLNQFHDPYLTPESSEGYIYLTTHNWKASKINEGRLAAIEADPKIYDASISGDFPESMYPINTSLHVKLGAQVMFMKNDPEPEKKYYNGKLGVVTDFGDNYIEVKSDGQTIVLESYVWENRKFGINDQGEVEEKVVGKFTHFPLKLAWSVTIHKSQGLTFEHAILDLSDSFAPGQMYVALSRLTSLKGLILATRIPDTVIPKDPSLENFERSKSSDEELINQLDAKSHQYLTDFVSLTYNLDDTKELFMTQFRSFSDLGTKSTKRAYLNQVHEWTDQLSELADVGFKFGRQMSQLLLSDTSADELIKRIEKAQTYYEPKLASLAESIQNARSKAAKTKGLKGFSKELKELSQQVINNLKEIRKAAPLTTYILQGNEPGQFDFSDLKELDHGKVDDKVPSKNISLELYKTGKNSFEIAEERQMAQSTIEGHLASFVESGEVNVMDFTTEEIKEKVGKLIAQKSLTLSELKQLLPDSVTYTQIRFAQEALK